MSDVRLIRISIAEQRLQVLVDGDLTWQTRIATARNGAGEQQGSERTPRGWHRIRACIGAGCANNTVFIGRRPSGEIYNEELGEAYTNRDWILTRIFWLCGMEPGRNRFGAVDTMRRYVYIHGCPDSHPMGVPSSHGCIKMRNADVIRLFEETPAGTQVWIGEGAFDAAAPRQPRV